MALEALFMWRPTTKRQDVIVFRNEDGDKLFVQRHTRHDGCTSICAWYSTRFFPLYRRRDAWGERMPPPPKQPNGAICRTIGDKDDFLAWPRFVLDPDPVLTELLL